MKPPTQASENRATGYQPAFFPTTGAVTGAAMGVGAGSMGGAFMVFTSVERRPHCINASTCHPAATFGGFDGLFAFQDAMSNPSDS